MHNYSKDFNPGITPQSEKASPEQIENRAGGFGFQVDKWTMLDRFLVLGSEGNTYYATEREMTWENAKNVIACLDEDGIRTAGRIADISFAGRAPKNDPAIFALALGASHKDAKTRMASLALLPRVCRTGTHLFQFVAAVTEMRGWGRGLKRAVAAWFEQKPTERLAMQVLKYQQRNGWSQRDLLRLSHPHAKNQEQAATFEWVRSGAGKDGFDGAREVRGPKGSPAVRVYPGNTRDQLPQLLYHYQDLKGLTTAQVGGMIARFGFTREMIPTEHLNSPVVWEALLENQGRGMPMTALVRNLGKMTAVGLLAPFSEAGKRVVAMLTNPELLKRGRVHPIALLAALKVYEQGHGERGKLSWNPLRGVIDALNEAFYLAFQGVVPTGKNHLLAIDISGSMDSGVIAGMPGITPRIAAAAMALVTARVEPNCHIIAFTSSAATTPARGRFSGLSFAGRQDSLTEVPISPNQRLDDVVRTMQGLLMGSRGTDCSIPFLYATARSLPVDAFCVYTDNETWAGEIHPHQALERYRHESGRVDAKSIVAAFTATNFSIANPADAGMLDVVGFDTACPQIMADFVRGEAAAGPTQDREEDTTPSE